MRGMVSDAQLPGPARPDGMRHGYAPADPDLVGSVRRRAAFLFGRPPDVLATAPGRIEIVGNHVDYNGGEVVAAAIDRWLILAARRRDDGVLTLSAGDIARGFGTYAIADAITFDQRERNAVRAWSDYGLASV